MSRSGQRATRMTRVASAWTVASVTTLVAAVAHLTAGGGAPSLAALALGLCGSGFLAMLVVGRRVRLASLLGAVIVDQVALHALFTLLGHEAAVAGSHHAHELTVLAEASPADPMVLHHVAAGLVSALLLSLGHRALVAVARSASVVLRRAVRLVDTALPQPLPPVPAVPAPMHRPLLSRMFAGTVLHRGPPVSFAS